MSLSRCPSSALKLYEGGEHCRPGISRAGWMSESRVLHISAADISWRLWNMRKHSSRLLWTTIVCCGLLVPASCSSDSSQSWGKLVPVEGKITFGSGKPLTDGNVVFVPLEKGENSPPAPRGSIGEDGSYRLFTKGKPGAPLGKYRAMLQAGTNRKTWSRVPSKYLSQKDSPLEVEIVEDKPEGGYDLKMQPQ